MTLKQALAALEKGGTAQNRKIYGHHGVTGDHGQTSCTTPHAGQYMTRILEHEKNKAEKK